MKRTVLYTLLLLFHVQTSCHGSPLPEEDVSLSAQGMAESSFESSGAADGPLVPSHRAPVPGIGCPKECTCEDAPLKAASFVLTWMTSWGEDDLPQLHPNDVMETEDFVVSSTAADADLDVDVVGLHATCALMPDANLTKLFNALPSRTMVLSILQAATSKLVVIEAGQLNPLNQLKALHLQGYARREATQVSGYTTNRVLEMVEEKEEMKKTDDEEQDLLMALSEDALMPLVNIQLLDLQYVRLVASLEKGRLRRQTNPVSTTTLLDLPLQEFLSLSDQMRGLDLPPEILSKIPTMPPAIQEANDVQMVLIDEDESVVPYDVFKSESDVVLAPFISQSQLKYLRVAHAKLDRVGQELLTGLPKLHTLTLEYNHIKVLPAAMFTPTPNIRHLSFAHNNILTIEASTLVGLDNMLTLDLDHNKLDRLGPGSFPSLPNLATLRLLNNPLTHIFPFTFANVNATEQLLLGSRDISAELHVDTFKQLGSLKVLQVENTTFLSLSRAFLEGMPGLKELTIHGHITSIDFDAFAATSNLESLNISHCHLHRLSLDAFFGLSKLRYLDISHNSIDELSPGTFDHLSSLRELYLHHNNLTTLPLGIFIPLPAKLIQLHQNPWHCTCDLLQLKPTVTNKVRQPAYTTCRWEETQGTVCTNEEPVRLRYDSRVAPMCVSPPHHSHFDVFHVTTRRLKCPKHLFYPRRNQVVNAATIIKAIKEEEEEEEEEEALILAEEEPNWLPLTAFSAAPVEVKDLLRIAEEEMPQEAFAPLTQNDLEEIEQERIHIAEMERELEDTEEMRLESKATRARANLNEDLIEHISIVTITADVEQPQRDEAPAYIRSFEKDVMRRQLDNYQLKKDKKKTSSEAERQNYQQSQQLKIEMYRNKMAAEKEKIKQQMEEERKILREKKAQQMKEFLRQQALEQAF